MSGSRVARVRSDRCRDVWLGQQAVVCAEGLRAVRSEKRARFAIIEPQILKVAAGELTRERAGIASHVAIMLLRTHAAARLDDHSRDAPRSH